MNRYLLPSGLVLLFAVSLSLGAYNNDSNTDISPNARTMNAGKMLSLSFIEAPGRTFGRSTAAKLTYENVRLILFASRSGRQPLNPEFVLFIKYIESVEYIGKGDVVEVQYNGKWMQTREQSSALPAVEAEAAPDAGDKINTYTLKFTKNSDAVYFVESFVRKMATEIGHKVRFIKA